VLCIGSISTVTFQASVHPTFKVTQPANDGDPNALLQAQSSVILDCLQLQIHQSVCRM